MKHKLFSRSYVIFYQMFVFRDPLASAFCPGSLHIFVYMERIAWHTRSTRIGMESRSREINLTLQSEDCHSLACLQNCKPVRATLGQNMAEKWNAHSFVWVFQSFSSIGVLLIHNPLECTLCGYVCRPYMRSFASEWVRARACVRRCVCVHTCTRACLHVSMCSWCERASQQVSRTHRFCLQ